MLLVVNPTGDLPGADREGKRLVEMAQKFPEIRVTPDAGLSPNDIQIHAVRHTAPLSDTAAMEVDGGPRLESTSQLPRNAFLIVSALVFVLSGYNSVSAVVKAELFPANVRALGVALPYAVANALFGGTAEYVALWFKGAGAEHGFYIYVSVIMAAAFVVAVRLRNTNVMSLIKED